MSFSAGEYDKRLRERVSDTVFDAIVDKQVEAAMKGNGRAAARLFDRLMGKAVSVNINHHTHSEAVSIIRRAIVAHAHQSHDMMNHLRIDGPGERGAGDGRAYDTERARQLRAERLGSPKTNGTGPAALPERPNGLPLNGHHDPQVDP